MKKILVFAMLVLLVIFLTDHFGLLHLLSDLHQLRSVLASFSIWSYLIFILLSILVSVFLLPGQLLAIVAGLCYGTLLGGILTIIGASLGCSISFILAKYIARDYIVKKFGQTRVFKKIEKGVRENGYSFLIFTRLVPIFPFAIQSYAYALTPMSLMEFSLISFVTIMPASFIYAYFAASIAIHGVSWHLLVSLAVVGLALALLSYLPRAVSKKMRDLQTKYKD